MNIHVYRVETASWGWEDQRASLASRLVQYSSAVKQSRKAYQSTLSMQTQKKEPWARDCAREQRRFQNPSPHPQPK
jgi:hypothetical protein